MKQLQIAHYLRDYFFELGAFASPHQICSELDIDREDMKAFFGSCANAWKIAGLPNPGEESASCEKAGSLRNSKAERQS